MPPKKAVKQPARQLTTTTSPARRRATGAAGTLDLTETQPEDVSAAGLPDETAPRTLPPAAPAPSRAVPSARPVPPARGVPPARRTAAATAAAGTNASGLRAMRGRVAQQIQGMDLREEMAWIRSDIGRLTVLAVAGFVLLIVLAIVLPMFNL
jgi:hypothetical protein